MIIDGTSAAFTAQSVLDLSFIRSKASSRTRLFHFYTRAEDSQLILKPYTKIIKAMDYYRLWNNFFHFQAANPKAVLSALQDSDSGRKFFFIDNHGIKERGYFTEIEGLAERFLPQSEQFKNLAALENPVVMMTSPPAEYGSLLHFLSGQAIMSVFFSQQEPSVLKKTIKESIMQSKKITIDNEAEIRAKIQDVMKKIRQKEDVFEMTEYKKLFHKNVSIFLRSYFAGYCIKYFLNSGKGASFTAPQTVARRDIPRETPRPAARESARDTAGASSASQPATPLTGDFQTLFVSVGKNRKVFPRDLSKLFATELEIQPTELGEINIFEKYAFIDIPTPIAQKAIDKINGQNYRGRKIVVNFARKKD
jgi:hypothetical protein